MTKVTTKSEPVAVLISDIHFTPATLDLATTALQQALDMTLALCVPLVIAGDTLDSKAIIRGECANRLLTIFKAYQSYRIPIYMLVGNHDLLSEKSKEHSLNFLSDLVDVVQSPVYVESLGSLLIPYQNDREELEALLAQQTLGTRIIMHQGVMGAEMGHYIKDSTSLPTDSFANFRVISGHYHKAQDIVCGPSLPNNVGLFSYIGNPYTLSFAEAHDGPKGFRILMSDGSLEFVNSNLRKHRIFDLTTQEVRERMQGTGPWYTSVNTDIDPDRDLIWIKVSGPYSELERLKKTEVGHAFFGHSNFKLDKIYTDAPAEIAKVETMTDSQILDSLIDGTDEDPTQKVYLKTLWREVLK